MHNSRNTYRTQLSFLEKKKAFTFVDVSTVVNVQPCGENQHQVKIEKCKKVEYSQG